MIVGLLHPGAMGTAVGALAQAEGHSVIWASAGRSKATRERAVRFRDAGSLEALLAEAEVVVSVCPPHAALEVATACLGFDGVYADLNAISPQHAAEIGALHPRFVDGGIIGGPDAPTIYLSASLPLFGDARVVSDPSALKMVYAAWSKGTAAMLLAIERVACSYGVEGDWRDAAPELEQPLARAQASAAAKGWRWVGEMEEIADTFAAAGQPDGFHRAAAEVFRS